MICRYCLKKKLHESLAVSCLWVGGWDCCFTRVSGSMKGEHQGTVSSCCIRNHPGSFVAQVCFLGSEIRKSRQCCGPFVGGGHPYFCPPQKKKVGCFPAFLGRKKVWLRVLLNGTEIDTPEVVASTWGNFGDVEYGRIIS